MIPPSRTFAAIVALACLCAGGWALSARGALKPEKIHVADSKKTQVYIRDGMIVGGDKAIDDVTIKDIRRAPNSGFERLVIDLEGNVHGEPAAIQRPPYFQVAVSEDEERLVMTLWGKPKLGFSAPKVINAFKKSVAVREVTLLPRLEEDSWTFALGLKKGRSVEVFELSNPVRIIVDIRSDQKKIVGTSSGE